MALSKVNPNFVNLSQIGGRRNIIHNGAGLIDQRQRGTLTGVTNALERHIDRWYTQLSTGATISTGGSYDVPAGYGFTRSINATVTSAGSMSAGYIFIQQTVEGWDSAAIRNNTAGNSVSGVNAFTISFWVKSSVTGTYACSVQSSNYDVSYNGTYTVNSANTWEYKTILVPAYTGGTWYTTNGSGINFRFCLGSSAGGTPNTWVSGSHNGATTSVDWANNSGATFYLTGVQVEAGSVATPFEHRPFAEEIEICKRYFQHAGHEGTSPYGTQSVTWDAVSCAVSQNHGAAAYDCLVKFSPPMRTTPTITIKSNSGDNYVRIEAVTISNTEETVNWQAQTNQADGIWRRHSTGLGGNYASSTVPAFMKFFWIAEAEM